jgi:hypothetical protein
MGRTAPIQTLQNTIIAKAEVTANASGRAVLKNIALLNPAILKITDKAPAILISLVKNWPRVLSFSVPSASPRITGRHIKVRNLFV